MAKKKNSLTLSRKVKNEIIAERVAQEKRRHLEALSAARIATQNAFFAKENDEAFRYYDPNLTTFNTSFQTFSKETLRTYLENPYSNSSNLRQLSRYLLLRSQVYRKIIWDNATMIDTHFRQIIPEVDLIKTDISTIQEDKNSQKIKKSLVETCDMVDKMNLPSEMLIAYLNAWAYDVFFGVYYYWDDEGGFLFPLDPDYCRITFRYATGDFGFDLDCTWLRSYQDQIELWGEPFESMWKEYQKDSRNNRWQPMPDEYACCFKVNIDDWKNPPTPPYMPLFNALINLEDLKEIQAIQAESQIYKMLSFEIPLFNNTNVVDDFSLDLNTAISYYGAAVKQLPDYIGAMLTPMKIEAISFPDDATTDNNKVEESSSNILKTAGHNALNATQGTTAMTAQLKADEDYAISSLLPQTEGWVNRQVRLRINDPSYVKFMSVTKFTSQEFKDSLIKDMNYGLPLITAIGALDGFSENQLMRIAYVHEMMDLRYLWYPYNTSATQGAHHRDDADTSGTSTAGRPKNSRATDESEASENKKESSG